MNIRNSLHDSVSEALAREKGTCSSDKASYVMQLAGQAVKLVDIDKRVLDKLVGDIQRAYLEADEGALRAALNKVLNIFGQRLISNQKEPKLDYEPTENEKISIINVDVDALSRVFHDIAAEINVLTDRNDRCEAKIRELEAHLSTAVRDAENAKNNLSREQSESAGAETEILKYLQRILAERGRANPPADNEAFGQLLEAMDITYSWEIKQEPMAFQTYKITGSDKVGVSLPCLYKNGEIAVKGLAYEANPGK